MSILEKIKEAKTKSKPRKFTQTWDLIFSLKGLNLKKPENRFSFEFSLPEGRGKEIKVAVIADSLVSEAKGSADLVVKKAEIQSLAKDKRKLRKIVNTHDFFFAEAPLMPEIAKAWGTVLGPRGKLPKPIPPKTKVSPIVQSAKKSIRVSVKESPVIQIPVGTDKMEDERVAKNIEAVHAFVREKLPRGKANIKSLYLKLTMGKPVKLEV